MAVLWVGTTACSLWLQPERPVRASLPSLRRSPLVNPYAVIPCSIVTEQGRAEKQQASAWRKGKDFPVNKPLTHSSGTANRSGEMAVRRQLRAGEPGALRTARFPCCQPAGSAARWTLTWGPNAPHWEVAGGAINAAKWLELRVWLK